MKEKKEEEKTFAERLALTGYVRECKCGRSKKYPLCDGSHSQE